MANYVWTPFSGVNVSGLELARNKIQEIEDLSQLGHLDVLYVFAHHDRFLPYIGDSNGHKLNVYELCDALGEAGLRRTHRCIKLWVCYGGVGMQQGQGFGWEFWYTMKNIYQFINLTVFAYTEITVDPIMDGHKYCFGILDPDAAPENRYYQLPDTAKAYRVGIRPNGAFIPAGQS